MIPAIAHSVVPEDVIINIKGGFGCTVIIQNNGNETINGCISIISHRLFIEGEANTTGHGPIQPGMSYSIQFTSPGFNSIYAMGQVGNLTVTKKGISVFRFVYLFKE